jgi:cysteine desulfurase/selenocysteine lyase
MDVVHKHEQELYNYAIDRFSELKDFKIFGLENKHSTGGVISFSYSDFHPHDIATILDGESIAVRAGHHCAQPLMEKLGVPATTRASFYVYNDTSDIDKLFNGLQKVRSVLT